MRVHEAAVDARFEVEDASGLPLGEHHVVEGELACASLPSASIRRASSRGRSIARAAALERIVHALEHVLRHHVGEETEPAAIDAEHGNAAGGDQARRIEHGTVAADDDSRSARGR